MFGGGSWIGSGGGGGGSGTVTSVGLSGPGIFSITGSPVTTSGTLAINLVTQSANLVWAGPTSGGAATPGFRSLVSADIPNLDYSKITTGVVPLANGGFGLGNTQTDLTTFGNIAALTPTTTLINFTSNSGTKTIQGMVNPGGNTRIVLRNTGGTALVVKNQDASATAANRFELEASKDLTLVSGAETEFMYNTTSSRWNVKEIRNQIANDSNNNLFSLISGTVGTNTNNIVLGNGAIGNNAYTGGSSIFIGLNVAKFASGSAINNTIVGESAVGTGILTSSNNTIVGSRAGTLLTGGGSNAFYGVASGLNTTTGDQNTFIGPSAGGPNTTGKFGLALGLSAGANHQTGDYNISIGQGTGSLSATNLSNTVTIGAGAKVTSSNQANIGSIVSPMNVGINNQNPIYPLDVTGNLNISGNYSINGVVQTPWTLFGNSGTSPGTNFIGTADAQDFVTKVNNVEVVRSITTGLTGFQKAVPDAVIHAGALSGTIADVSVVNTQTQISASGGYGFTSGNKDYEAYGKITVSGVDVLSASPATTTYLEPSTSDFDPSSASASEVPGSGYDTSTDPTPSYQIWAQYDSGAVVSVSTTSAGIGSWSGSNPFADVQLSWSAPINGGGLSGYFVVRNGTDSQTVSGTSLTDSNSSWGGGGSPSGSPLSNYNVVLNLIPVSGTSVYRYLNTTSGTFIDGSSSLNDDANWVSGSTVTPTTADYLSINAEGDVAISTAGKGLRIKEGSGNAKMGNDTLSSGSVTVSTSAVKSTSRIFVAALGSSAGHGALWVTNIVDGVSFDINSTNVLDNSSVNWIIFDPAN
jgi:hypothetical protein